MTENSSRSPTREGVLKAAAKIAKILPPTPLLPVEINGTNCWVKCENLQPIGAFKIRGGINLISQLTPQEKQAGVVTASTGNHGQSIALASSIYGVKARICVPEHSNPGKVAAIKNYGAEIIEKGKDFDEARLNAEKLAEQHGYRCTSTAETSPSSSQA